MNGKLRVLGIILGIWAVTGVLAWLALQNIPRATCAQTEDEQDFDLVVEYIAANQTDTLVTTNFEVRVSGEDYHSLIDRDGAEGVEEYMVKDGVHYEKRVDGEWTIKEEPASGLDFIWYLIDSRPRYTDVTSEHILCPIEGEDFKVQKFWFDETIPGPVYSGGSDWESNPWIAPAFAAELPDIKARWEYWPSMDGHLYNSAQFFDVIGGEDWEKVEIAAEISEVGVPNVITAPTIPSQ